MKIRQFHSSGEVRKELSLLYSSVKNDTLPLKKAETLKGLLNAILISLSVEIKEEELQVQQNLLNQIQQVRGRI